MGNHKLYLYFYDYLEGAYMADDIKTKDKDKSKWSMFSDAVLDAKKIIATGAIIIGALIGGYEVVTEHFVTRVYAEEMVSDVEKKLSQELNELKLQTKSNSNILVEMQMIRLESKLSRDENLTPTEKRVYEKLKKQYEEQ
jgi:hypothetical protein